MYRRVDGFYNNQTWKRVQKEYKKSVGGLCERCLKAGVITAGVIVHHKTHLTEENKTDPAIAYGFDNLELLCMDCHNKEHFSKKRFRVDEFGRVICKD